MFLGFYDFWTWHQKVILGPPSPPPPPHRNGNLGFYDFWTHHQKVIFGPPSPPPPYIKIGSDSLMCHLQFGVHRGKVCFWDFMIFGLGIKK